MQDITYVYTVTQHLPGYVARGGLHVCRVWATTLVADAFEFSPQLPRSSGGLDMNVKRGGLESVVRERLGIAGDP